MNLRMIDPAEAPAERFDAELAALIKAREEGLIDGVGLSNVSRRQLLRAVDQTEIVCVQNLFNLVDQGSADVLTECAKRGIAFVSFCPLGLPDARTRSWSAGIAISGDAGPDRARLVARPSAEHLAHSRHPDPRPPGRELGGGRVVA